MANAKVVIRLDRTNTGLVIGDMTFDFCNKVSDGTAVSVVGVTMREEGVGVYTLNNPNITEDTVFSIYKTADSTIYAEGVFSLADDNIKGTDGKMLISTNSQDLSGNLDVNVKTKTSTLGLTTQEKADVNAEADTANTEYGANKVAPNTVVPDAAGVAAGLIAGLGSPLQDDDDRIPAMIASQAEVLAIQNNTRVRVIIPPVFERPDTGITYFALKLYLYDEIGNMEAPDELPTITAKNQSGVDRSGNLGVVVPAPDSAGSYEVPYALAFDDLIEQLLFEWTTIEGGVTRKHGGATQVVDTTAVDFTADDRSKLSTLYGDGSRAVSDIPDNPLLDDDGRLPATVIAAKSDLPTAPDNASITDIKNAIQSATYGLSKLKTLIDDIDTSSELAARFTELKGAGFTTETLKAIKDAIDGLENIKASDVWAYVTRKLTSSLTDEGTPKDMAAVADVGDLPSTEDIDNLLSASHGTGSWESASPYIIHTDLSVTDYDENVKEIKIYTGTTPEINFIVTKDGEAVDIEGKTVYLVVKKSEGQLTSKALINKLGTVYDTGQVDIHNEIIYGVRFNLTLEETNALKGKEGLYKGQLDIGPDESVTPKFNVIIERKMRQNDS